MNFGLKVLRFFAVFFALCSGADILALPPYKDIPPQTTPIQIGSVKFMPSLLGLSEKNYEEVLVPGFNEAAEAAQTIIADIYTQRKILEENPHWKGFLKDSRTYWPELVGQLKDLHFARFSAIDLRSLVNTKNISVFQSGPNVGGAAFALTLGRVWRTRPELGALPSNEDIFDRWVEHLKDLSNAHFGNSDRHFTVFADAASVRAEPVLVGGELITPPMPLPREVIQLKRDKITEAGAVYLSLIDDRDQLVIRDEVLFWRNPQTGEEKRIDVFVSLAEPSIMDPSHEAQIKRNALSSQKDLNSTLKLTGIPGLVSSWLSGSFVWVGNPATELLENEHMTTMITDYIRRQKGRAPILSLKQYSGPLIARRNLAAQLRFTQNGASLDAESVQSIQIDNADWVPTVRQLGLVSGGGANFKSSLSRHMVARFDRQQKTGGDRESSEVLLGIAVPADTTELKFLSPLVDIGVNQGPIPVRFSEENKDLIARDARQRALVEGYLLRAIYKSPEVLFKKFPALKPIIERSVYYRPQYMKDRLSRDPSIFLSAPDYMQKSDGSFVVLEHNVTNVGGLIRQWLQGYSEVRDELRRMFVRLKALSGKSNPKIVYFLEWTKLGAEWSEIQKKFADDFSSFKDEQGQVVSLDIELASLPEVKNFSHEGIRVFYKSNTSEKKQVDVFISHIEPDFLDPEVATDAELLTIMTPEELHERREHAIKGIMRAVQSGSLLAVNESGQDIVCAKALLPFMPELRKYFLGREELIPTQPSRSLSDENGKLRREILDPVLAEPGEFVIKDSEITGNGGGVHVFRLIPASQHSKIFPAVEASPTSHIVQDFAPSMVDETGAHSEWRIYHTVSVDLNSQEEPKIIAAFTLPYVRAANGRQLVNVLPSATAKVRNQPGFVRRVSVIPCARVLAALHQGEI